MCQIISLFVTKKFKEWLAIFFLFRVKNFNTFYSSGQKLPNLNQQSY